MAQEFKVAVTLRADASQYTAEFGRAGQIAQSFSAQLTAAGNAGASGLQAAAVEAQQLGASVSAGSQAASTALQSTATAAQTTAGALNTASTQATEGLARVAQAHQRTQGTQTHLSAAGNQFLGLLREQIATSGKTTDALLRYRAAQAGVAAEAAPLILQWQNQRAAQIAAAQAAEQEAQAQREAAATKQRLQASQDSFLSSLREQAALQGKSAIEVLEYRAAQLGVSQSSAQYIQSLKDGAQAHRNGAISAGQHAQAMRMLPAQMTDVVTSIASGMPIWMVAVQQGGQIKDSFGGMGNAAKALVSAVTPVAAILAGVTAALGLTAAAYYQGSEEADRYRQAIVMSGNAAGLTTSQLGSMAQAVSQTLGTQNQASRVLAAMAGDAQVAGDNLQHFTEVALALERYAGQSIQTTVQHLSELGKAPVEASLKLNAQYRYLTDAVYVQIKALQEQGRHEEAAALAQRTYSSAMGERTAELQRNLGTLERAWARLSTGASKAWDAMRNIGRPATLDDIRTKIDATNRELNTLLNGNGFESTEGGAALGAGGRGRAAAIARLRKELGDLHAQAAPLENEESQAQLQAQAQAKEQEQLLARQRIDGLRQNVRTRAEIRQSEIEQLNQDRRTLELSDLEYQRLLTGIHEKYKDPAPSTAGQVSVTDTQIAGLRSQLQAAQRYHQQLQVLGASAQELNAGERESLKLAEQITLSTNAKTQARLQEAKATADALGVQLRSNDGLEKAFKDQQQLNAAMASSTQSIVQRAKDQEAANTVFGKGRTAIEQMTLAELKHQMAQAQASDRFMPQYVAELQAQIEAQERWVDALGQADYQSVQQHTQALLQSAQELSHTYAQELNLSALSGLEREKLVALRAVEVKYAKELADLDKSALTDAQKQEQRQVILTAKRLESAHAVASATQSAMTKASDDINRSLTDALMEGGKNGAEYIEGLFRSMVLRPMFQAAVQPVAGALSNAVTSLAGGGSDAGALSGANGLSSLFSAFSGGLTSTLASGIGTLGSMFGSAAVSSFASGMTSAAAGVSAAGAGGALGAGAAFGAAVPWIAGAIALYQLIDSLDGSGDPHKTGIASYSASTGSLRDLAAREHYDPGFTTKEYSEAVSTGLSDLAKGLSQTLDAFSQSFGEAAKHAVTLAWADDYDGEGGSWGGLRITRGTESLIDWKDGAWDSQWAPREFDPQEEGYEQYLNAVAADMATVLADSVHAQWAKQSFEGVRDIEGLQAALQSIAAIQVALAGWSHHITQFGQLGDEALSRLMAGMGGFESLASGMNAFYQGYFSEAERFENAALQLDKVLAGLDLSIDPRLGESAKQQFRDTVLAAMESGNDALLGPLLSVAQSFSDVADHAQQAADANKQAADSTADLAEQVNQLAQAAASERYGLETHLLQLLGDTSTLRQRELDTLHESNRGLQQHIWALEDAQAAYDTALGSAQTAFQGLQASVEAEKSVLQSQYEERKTALQQQAQAASQAQQAQVSAAQAAAKDIETIATQLAKALNAVKVESLELTRTRLEAARGVLNQAHQQGHLKTPGLEDALALVSSDTTRLYGHWEDWARDQARTAATLQDLHQHAQAQLSAQAVIVNAIQTSDSVAQSISAAEMSALEAWYAEELAALDAQLTDGEAQLNALLGIDTSVLSVADAVTRLETTIAQALGLKQQLDALSQHVSDGFVSSADNGGGGGSSAPPADYTDDELRAMGLNPADIRAYAGFVMDNGGSLTSAGVRGVLDSMLREGQDALDRTYGIRWSNNTDSFGNTYASASDYYSQFTPAQQLQARKLYTNGSENGISHTELQQLLGMKVPAFASGGAHLGGWRLVGENGPELEYTAPSHIFNANDTRQMLASGSAISSTDLAAIRQLLERMARQGTSQTEAIQFIKEAIHRVMGSKRDSLNVSVLRSSV